MERETKFDVDGGFALPDLAAAGGDGVTAQSAQLHLESTYYDTADFALVDAHITLRRRTGDGDTGWQLKIPHGAARLEIGLPLEAGEAVPHQLADIVSGVAAGAPLETVAVLRTERRVVRLGGQGTVLAEVADDTVHSAAAGEAARVQQWREVEVELVDGDERLLDALGDALERAGARPATSSSKLARALDRPAAPAPGRGDAAAVVRAYLADQYAALCTGDVALRRGQDDAIHPTRVGVRRLRSALRVYRPVLEGGVTRHLEDELSWLQNLLGAVRDAQVQRGRVAAAVAALPPELVLGPVSAELDQTLLSEQARAFADLREAVTTERYRALMQALRGYVAAPPVLAGTSPKALQARAAAARRTAAKRLARARRGDTPALAHRARKAVKRARYAAELVGPLTGRKKTAATVDELKELQDVLGAYQDSVLGSQLLRRIGAGAGSDAGHNGFTYGLLLAEEQRRQRKLRKRVARLKL